MRQKNPRFLLPLLVIVLAAVVMRAPMGCVGPLVGDIRSSLGIPAVVAGLLTTIPLIAFALSSPIAGRLAVSLDSRVLLLGTLFLTIIGLALRSYAGTAGLFLGTLLLGFSIGTLGVFLPALIRHCFPEHLGLVMGIFSSAMTAASALSSGTCEWIAASFGGWRAGLVASILPTILTIAVCLFAQRSFAGKLSAGEEVGRYQYFNGKNMSVAAYWGLQAFLFFTCITWFPSIWEDHCGLSGVSGKMLLLMQLCCLPPTFLLPILCEKVQRKGLLTVFCTLLFVPGIALLLPRGQSLALAVLSSVLLGLANGATMSLGLTFVALRGRTAAETAGISALTQCIGYLLAAFGPMGIGFVFDLTGKWDSALLLLMIFAVMMALVGSYSGSVVSTSGETK